MGGQDRAYQRAIEEVGKRARLDAHLARALKGVSERARTRRRARDRMGPVAADVMLIFGDVGEMREIAIGANDRERLVSVEAVERRLELAPRANLVVAMEANRGLADLLDQLENLFALLLAHGVAENTAEQTNVVAQRNVLLAPQSEGSALDFGGHGHRRIRRLNEDRCCTAANTGARPGASWRRRAQFRSQVPRQRKGLAMIGRRRHDFLATDQPSLRGKPRLDVLSAATLRPIPRWPCPQQPVSTSTPQLRSNLRSVGKLRGSGWPADRLKRMRQRPRPATALHDLCCCARIDGGRSTRPARLSARRLASAALSLSSHS